MPPYVCRGAGCSGSASRDSTESAALEPRRGSPPESEAEAEETKVVEEVEAAEADGAEGAVAEARGAEAEAVAGGCGCDALALACAATCMRPAGWPWLARAKPTRPWSLSKTV